MSKNDLYESAMLVIVLLMEIGPFHRIRTKAFQGPMCGRMRSSGKVYCRSKIKGLFRFSFVLL